MRVVCTVHCARHICLQGNGGTRIASTAGKTHHTHRTIVECVAPKRPPHGLVPAHRVRELEAVRQHEHVPQAGGGNARVQLHAVGDSIALRRRFHYFECPAYGFHSGTDPDIQLMDMYIIPDYIRVYSVILASIIT